MSQPNLRDDLEFVKKEILLGVGFVADYFKGKAGDRKKKHLVQILELGPIDGGKLILVILGSLFCLFYFALYRSESAIIVFLIIFAFLYDLAFGKGWMVPIITEMWNVVKEIPKAIFELGKDIITSFKD
jgi:hypothetical protein